jgi:osmotically-inducible protein OsmY
MILLRVGLMVSLLYATGCSNGDVERLGRIARTLAERFENLTEGAKAKLAGNWSGGSLEDSAIAQRVRQRIRWDEQFANCEIEVDAPERGVVRLRGVVANLDKRRRAVDLAQSTIGVERVEDALTTN